MLGGWVRCCWGTVTARDISKKLGWQMRGPQGEDNDDWVPGSFSSQLHFLPLEVGKYTENMPCLPNKSHPLLSLLWLDKKAWNSKCFTFFDIINFIRKIDSYPFLFCNLLSPEGWIGAYMVAQWWRICLPMQEMWVQYPGQEDSLEEEMATHSNILTWETPSKRILAGYGPWGRKESDITQRLNIAHKGCK